MERKMRLIDPEVFEKELQRYADAEETQSIINTGGRFMSWEHRQVLQTITAMESAFKTIMDCMPTVEAVPVRHGTWELEHETWGKTRCSRCKEEALLKKIDGDCGPILVYVTNGFCPHCGCEMGDENESR